MKFKKYILSILSIALITTGCNNDFGDMNQDPFNPTETSLPPVFNSLTSSLLREWQPQTQLEYEAMGLSSQITNIYGSSGYLPANAATDLWKNYYKYLADASLFDRLVEENETGLNVANIVAQKEVINAFKTLKMVDIFGDIPYSEAAKAIDGPDNFYPKYDDQKVLYMDMIEELKQAEANMVESPGDDFAKIGSYDVLFKDDILMWRKFANSIRLREAIKAFDAENSLASHVTDILGGNLPLIEDGEDVKLNPVALDLDLRGPIWAYSGGKVRFSTSMFEAMSDGTDETDIFDPRLRLFSEVNSNGTWNPMPFTGGITETGNPNAENRWQDEANAGTYTYSPINYWMLTGRYSVPELILTAAEVHFLKAEAYAKGVGVSVDMTMAKEEYEKGIKSSITYWFETANFSKNFGDDYSWRNVPSTPTDAEINAMLANPKVAWDNSTALELIYTQRWISHIRQIRLAWGVWRQTKMTPQQGNEFVFHRSVYPQSEQDNNQENYKAVVQKMGGSDDSSVKIWWAK